MSGRRINFFRCAVGLYCFFFFLEISLFQEYCRVLEGIQSRGVIQPMVTVGNIFLD